MSNGFSLGFGDDVDVAERQHAIEIAVAAEAPHAHRFGQRVEAGPHRSPLNISGVVAAR